MSIFIYNNCVTFPAKSHCFTNNYYFLIIDYSSSRVRHNLKAHVGDVDAAAVPCGFGRAIGNKVRLPLFGRFLLYDTN